MTRLFGTDGVRGVANKDLTPELAMEIGRAGAYALSGKKPPKVLIGTDTRLSSDMLEAALVAGLCSVGAEVHRAGVVPSPAMAHLVRHYKMDAGVMLSASHNPMPDNGIKFFDKDGFKLSDEIEDRIEELIRKTSSEIPRPTSEGVGRAILREEASKDYVDFLLSTLQGSGSNEMPLSGMTLALDCANGATSATAAIAFEKLGAKCFILHDKPDGKNINANCGSTHMESLQKFVKANKVDMGFAFDGDGDRVLCVDELGEELDGDCIMAVLGQAMNRSGRLKNNTIVVTVMSNMGFEIFCKENDINFIRTAVGDRYVIQEMKTGGYNLGGEQSGHIIISDFNTSGDGILTGLHLAAVLKESGKTFSELRKIMAPLPQVLLGAKLGSRQKIDVRENKEVATAMDKVEAELGDKGRLLIRPSGTEPLVRVMIEGSDQSIIEKHANDLVAVIEKNFAN